MSVAADDDSDRERLEELRAASARWSQAALDAVAAGLRESNKRTWHPFLCKKPMCDGMPHVEPPWGRWDFRHGRFNQHPPQGDWLTWLLLGGRGGGKTRTGSEWVHRRVERSPRVALIAPTGPDGRDTIVEGESGLLATAKPGSVPAYEPSKRKLTWPNGATAHLFSGEEPDRLRGPQHYDAWIDEPAHIPLIADVWDNLLFGMRLGQKPRICATTTPTPSPWIKKMVKDPTTAVVVTSTYDNIQNLAPSFRSIVISRYEGTRKGRQELLGEVLEDVEGAMWSPDIIEVNRVPEAPEMSRIVVAVDPAGTATARSDETGIIVVGAAGDQLYVLADHSGKYTPNGWASQVSMLFQAWEADSVVVEKNYGGDMVANTLHGVNPNLPVREVTSRRGKALRADPIAALYERGVVHHVGLLNELEDQMTSWVVGNPSPDRLDALVHGLTSLAALLRPSAIASPDQLRIRIQGDR